VLTATANPWVQAFVPFTAALVEKEPPASRPAATRRPMPERNVHEAEIDRIARVMAASAGGVWDRLDHYPGYMRGYWRSEARTLLARITAGDLRTLA
jgi:hypothetical protein